MFTDLASLVLYRRNESCSRAAESVSGDYFHGRSGLPAPGAGNRDIGRRCRAPLGVNDRFLGGVLWQHFASWWLTIMKWCAKV